jgi:hypothetical protein
VFNMAIKKPMTAARERDILKMAAPACAAALAFVIGAASPSAAFCAGLWVPGTIVTNLPDAFVLQYDQAFTAPGSHIRTYLGASGEERAWRRIFGQPLWACKF